MPINSRLLVLLLIKKRKTRDMEKCLIDNKVCSERNKKCKECKLDDCKQVIKMIEDEQKYIDIDNMRKLKKALPEECKNCTIWIVTNLAKQKVYCPYRIKNKCIIKKTNES